MHADTGVVNRVGAWGLVVASLAGLAVSVFDYVTPSNGIAGSFGALLVVVTSVLLVAASLTVAFALVGRRWVRVMIDMLLCLGILGTGFAAYMLEADVLLAMMMVAFVGWLAHLCAVPRAVHRAAKLQPGVA